MQVQKTYKSKIDPWLLIFLIAAFGYPLVYMVLRESRWFGLVVWLPLTVLVIYSVITIRYTIAGDMLLIKSIGFNSAVPVKAIRRVEETHSLLSSPAASLDRLEIVYNRYDSVLVSPKDKSGFIADLKAINPEIEVKMKPKQG